MINKNFRQNRLELEEKIDTTLLGKIIYYFDEIDSTNDYAKKIASYTDEGTVVLAGCQTKGKGRFERTWVSDKDGIFLSLVLKPSMQLNRIIQITLLSSICVLNTISKMTDLKPKIKWPNDIIINNKKVAGILTEVVNNGKEFNVIVGIGVNLNNKNFDDLLKHKATSIFLETNILYKKDNFISLFLKEFEQKYLTYKNEKSFDLFLDDYKSLCINIGKQAKVIYNNKEIVGKVIDISDMGEVIFKCENNEIKIISGEVLLRNINGEYI